MTFTTQTQALRQVLAAVTAVIQNKPVVQILNNVLVEVTPGILALTACNTEQTITMRIPAETQDTDKFLINARDLSAIVKAANFDTITFDLNAPAVNIGCGFSDYSLPVLPTNDFPTQTFSDTQTVTVELNSNDIALALSRVGHAVSTDDLRPALKGVYFEITSDSFIAVATDTRVLSKFSTQYTSEQETSVIIPSTAIKMLQGSFLSEPTVKVTFYTNGAVFECGGNEFITTLVNGKFPPYGRVIPQTHASEVKFNRKDFMSAVGAASALSDTTGMARLEFTPSECVVSVSNLDYQQKSKSRCECEFSGTEMTIYFNLKYLQAVLKSIDAEEIALKLTDASRPGVFVGVGDESTLNLLMPMQG